MFTQIYIPRHKVQIVAFIYLFTNSKSFSQTMASENINEINIKDIKKAYNNPTSDIKAKPFFFFQMNTALLK